MAEQVSGMEPGRFDPTIPHLLPHENMYKIQVGTKLFKISGASLSSDGPSFFTERFAGTKSQGENVLFIDRSAEIFELIYLHLQGYFIEIKDEVQFTMLFADAMYYGLPRLRALLREYEYYFANISGRTFKIARSLFSREGDSPNYFSMTSNALYADSHAGVFINKKLIRPPPQSALSVPRSAELFQELLQLLGGASLELDDKRRESLIKECRYYRFLNLEQRLIKARASFNQLTQGETILLALKDIARNGVSFNQSSKPMAQDGCCPTATTGENTPVSVSDDQQPLLKKPKTDVPADKARKNWNLAQYKRPYLDTRTRDLLFQIDTMDCTLIFNRQRKTVHLEMMDQAAMHFEKVFAAVLHENDVDLSKFRIKDQRKSAHLGLPACLSIGDCVVNGSRCSQIYRLVAESSCDEKVVDLTNADKLSYCSGLQLHLTKSIWKLGVSNGDIILIALKVDAFTGAREFCKKLDYL
ncbi:hypothetical protein HG536_0C01550 [Torulaspora globosa]|uniref:BTB domain-containing protein n=1 Tax=Torulaspora globosa TaxID=48254 RepID=A0A7G3ZEQ1_9SACH|nr:uncharacterized protein HG536_0C01550 [Torulaspora globosa]QLL31987.1 hypothetical protein HG536_0C01550 [Torulaspora globosa]